MDVKADKVNLKKLLANMDEQFHIPDYQRPYAWTSDEVDDLWDDIITGLPSGHFLGSLVLAAEEDERPEVIDGQQRITTIMLLLAAIRDELARSGASGKPVEDVQKRFEADGHGDGEFKFRTGDANWSVFRDFVLRRPGDPARKEWADYSKLSSAQRARNKPLHANAERLLAHLRDWLGAVDSETKVEKLKYLTKALLDRIEFVAIRVGNVSDAFLLFETLNDRGLQLSAADLLKSHLLARLSSEQGTSVVSSTAEDWDEMIDSLRGADVTRFLRHVLLIKTPNINQTEVFDQFKEQLKTSGPGKVFAELRELARWYGEFHNSATVTDDGIRQVLLDLQTLRATSCYIALLPARRYLSDDAFADFARVCESLTFRYSSVSGLSAKDLKRKYHEAAQLIDRSMGKDLFAARALLARMAPSREQFTLAFQQLTMGRQYLVRYALERIERKIADHGEYELKPGAKVHIEHILPKQWQKHWSDDLAELAVEAEEFVDRRGNLTLLLDSWNIEASNQAFDTKRAAYRNSKLAITRDLTRYENWGPRQIEERQRHLAELANEIWTVSPG